MQRALAMVNSHLYPPLVGQVQEPPNQTASLLAPKHYLRVIFPGYKSYYVTSLLQTLLVTLNLQNELIFNMAHAGAACNSWFQPVSLVSPL